MQFVKQVIVVESSAFNAWEGAEHIKLIVGDTSGVIFNLSPGQARSLAKSLVQHVHRLEVANSMRKTKLQKTCSIQRGVKNSGTQHTYNHDHPHNKGSKMKRASFAVLRSFAPARTISYGAALFLGLLVSATSSSATVLTATDSSWKLTASTPIAADWKSNATFDDSAWQSATELSSWLGYTAKVIWSSGGQFSTTETQVWARAIFNLGTLPLSALLNNGFDDDGDIFINGVQVINDHNGFANNSYADITPYLTLGDNLIAFTALDNFQTYGFNHGAAVQVDATFAQVPEPATLALLGLGLVGLGLVRRRNA